MKPILFNFTDSELDEFVAGLSQPRFRARQIRDWLNRGAPDFESMKNLPAKLRAELDEAFRGQEPLLKEADLHIENEEWEAEHPADEKN